VKQEQTCIAPVTEIKCDMTVLGNQDILFKVYIKDSTEESLQKRLAWVNTHFWGVSLTRYRAELKQKIQDLRLSRGSTSKWFIPKGFHCSHTYNSLAWFPSLSSYIFTFQKFSTIFPKYPSNLIEPYISIRTHRGPSRGPASPLPYPSPEKINLEDTFIFSYSDLLSYRDSPLSHFPGNFTVSIIFPSSYYTTGSLSITFHERVELKIIIIITCTIFLIILLFVFAAIAYIVLLWCIRIYYILNARELPNAFAFSDLSDIRRNVYFRDPDRKSFSVLVAEKFIRRNRFCRAEVAFGQENCIICLNVFCEGD
jgi:hypothetical protein